MPSLKRCVLMRGFFFFPQQNAVFCPPSSPSTICKSLHRQWGRGVGLRLGGRSVGRPLLDLLGSLVTAQRHSLRGLIPLQCSDSSDTRLKSVVVEFLHSIPSFIECYVSGCMLVEGDKNGFELRLLKEPRMHA